jgi:hypothetical protein
MTDAMLGIVSAHHYSALHDSLSALNKTYVRDFTAGYGRRPNFITVGGYDGMHLIYEALKKKVAPQPRLPKSPVDPGALAECADDIALRMKAAERPVIVVDVEVRRYGLEAKVAALARRLGAPVVTTFMGRGLLSGHPRRHADVERHRRLPVHRDGDREHRYGGARLLYQPSLNLTRG